MLWMLVILGGLKELGLWWSCWNKSVPPNNSSLSFRKEVVSSFLKKSFEDQHQVKCTNATIFLCQIEFISGHSSAQILNTTLLSFLRSHQTQMVSPTLLFHLYFCSFPQDFPSLSLPHASQFYSSAYCPLGLGFLFSPNTSAQNSSRKHFQTLRACIYQILFEFL